MVCLVCGERSTTIAFVDNLTFQLPFGEKKEESLELERIGKQTPYIHSLATWSDEVAYSCLHQLQISLSITNRR